MIIPTAGCAPKRTTADTTTSSDPTIAQLQKDVKDLKSAFASLPDETNSTDYSADIEQLHASIDDLQAQLDGILTEVDTMLADWEAAQETNSETNSGGATTTRWTPSINYDLELGEETYNIDVDWPSSRIREEDTYSIEVVFANPSTTDTIPKSEENTIIITLEASSKDTSVDIGNTGLYSGSIFWDSEFSPGNGVNCRWMEFASEKFDIKALAPGKSYVLEIDFDLYYQD